VVLFHPGLLHGGGARPGGRPRRTLSIRFFGDDVVYQPKARPAPPYPGTSALVAPGQPLRGPWFPQLYPRPAAD
jgi:ectoine hydroxylase-related dioxygenase (phytanoyl-CoA dioxygenase family)